MDKKSKDHPLSKFRPTVGEAKPKLTAKAPLPKKSEPAYPEARNLFSPEDSLSLSRDPSFSLRDLQPLQPLRGGEGAVRSKNDEAEPIKAQRIFLDKTHWEIMFFILCACLSGLGLGVLVAFLLENGQLDLTLKEVKDFSALINSF